MKKSVDLTAQSVIMVFMNDKELTGHDLLIYLMGRWNMTRQEALHSMRQAGHDISKL